MLTMSEQLSLVLGMLLGFGVVFEVPVVIAFLAMIGVVDWRTLAKYRRVAIIVNVVVAAIITPTGDPLNLAFMARADDRSSTRSGSSSRASSARTPRWRARRPRRPRRL